MNYWLFVAIAAVVIIVLLTRRSARSSARRETPEIAEGFSAREPSQVSAPLAATREVAVVRPSLPPGRGADIVSALQGGIEPDESWMASADASGGGVRLLPFTAQFQSVAGESARNPDGVERQSILASARPGSEVYLVPEPTNRFDAEAIAVYLDLGGGATGQIGYLPKGNNLKAAVATNKAVAWLARVSRREAHAPLGAVLYVLVANS